MKDSETIKICRGQPQCPGMSRPTLPVHGGCGGLATAVLARRGCLVTLDRDVMFLSPPRQLLLLEG